MVQVGIVLGHKVSAKGIEVDRAKIEVMEKLPPPLNVKEVRGFLSHVEEGTSICTNHGCTRLGSAF